MDSRDPRQSMRSSTQESKSLRLAALKDAANRMAGNFNPRDERLGGFLKEAWGVTFCFDPSEIEDAATWTIHNAEYFPKIKEWRQALMTVRTQRAAKERRVSFQPVDWRDQVSTIWSWIMGYGWASESWAIVGPWDGARSIYDQDEAALAWLPKAEPNAIAEVMGMVASAREERTKGEDPYFVGRLRVTLKRDDKSWSGGLRPSERVEQLERRIAA